MTVKGKVKVMTETFPLDDAADAYEKMASGKVRFCAVYSLSPNFEVFSVESLWARYDIILDFGGANLYYIALVSKGHFRVPSI
jgi:hypothetical protein